MDHTIVKGIEIYYVYRQGSVDWAGQIKVDLASKTVTWRRRNQNEWMGYGRLDIDQRVMDAYAETILREAE